MASLDQIIRLINKDQGDDVLFLGKDWKKPEISKISTGSLYLDWATNGGIPVGRITEIYGNESTGKSAIATKVVREAQKKKMTCIWVDAENSFDSAWMTKLGVDVSQLIVAQIAEGESAHDLLFKIISLGNPRSKEYKDIEPVDLVVLDSVTALAPTAVTANDMQAHMAVDARMNNLGFKRINARNKNTALIVINQNRSSIGGRTVSDFQPGGRALKFFASLRIEVRGGEWITSNSVPKYMKVASPRDKNSPIGFNIRFRVRKSKIGPPHKEANLDFYYEGKIDQIKDIIAAAKITEVIEQAGAFYKYDGQSYRGAEAFGAFLRSDKAALKDIREKVLAFI